MYTQPTPCDTFRVLEQRYRNGVSMITLKMCRVNWKFHGGVECVSVVHMSHTYYNIYHILCIIIHCLRGPKNIGAESGVFPS